MYKKLLIIQILFTFAVSVFSFTPDRIPLIEEKPDDVNIISSDNFDIEVKLPFNASSSQTDGISFLPVESIFECFNTASGVFDSFVIEGGTCFQQHISPWFITPEYMSNILNHKFIHATNEATDSFERYLCENSNFSLKLLSSQQLCNWNNPNNPISTTGEFNVTITKGLLLIYSGVIDFGASINVPITEDDKYRITTTLTGGNGMTIMTSSGSFYVNNQVSFDYYNSQSNNEDFIENSDQSVEGNERIKMRTGLSVVPSTLSIDCPVRIKVISSGVMNNNSSTTPSKLILEYPFKNVLQIDEDQIVYDFFTGIAESNGNINMGRWNNTTYTGTYTIKYNDYSWE